VSLSPIQIYLFFRRSQVTACGIITFSTIYRWSTKYIPKVSRSLRTKGKRLTTEYLAIIHNSQPADKLKLTAAV